MYPEDLTNSGALRREMQNPDQNECSARAVFERCTFPLAMVYTPLQSFHDIYDKEKALNAGTIFRELDLPFHGKSVFKGGHI